jgi:hypothetical protein
VNRCNTQTERSSSHGGVRALVCETASSVAAEMGVSKEQRHSRQRAKVARSHNTPELHLMVMLCKGILLQAASAAAQRKGGVESVDTPPLSKSY